VHVLLKSIDENYLFEVVKDHERYMDVYNKKPEWDSFDNSKS